MANRGSKLVATFASTGVPKLVSDTERVGRAMVQAGYQADTMATKMLGLWHRIAVGSKTAVTEIGAVGKATKTLGTDLGTLQKRGGAVFDTLIADSKKLPGHFSAAGTAGTRFFQRLQTEAGTTQRALDRLIRTANSFRMPSAGSGGGSGRASGVGSALGGAVGQVGSLIGQGLTAVVKAGAAIGGDIVVQGATLDRKRSTLTAAIGDKVTPAMIAAMTSGALRLGAAKDTGNAGAAEVFDAATELAKAGYDPNAILNSKGDGSAHTVLRMRAAAGADKMTTADAAKLFVTGKASFGRFNLSDDQIANSMVGFANATPLGMEDIQGIISSGGATAAGSGMDMTNYLGFAAMLAQAGINPGQIGGAIRQDIRMADPRSKTAMAAMQKLGLVTTETHTEGARAAIPGTPGGINMIGGKPVRTKAGRGKAATKGKKVTTVTGNKLWDANGKFVGIEQLTQMIGQATAGLSDHDAEQLLSDAFNPKAAPYLMAIRNLYMADHDIAKKTLDQIAAQGNASKTATTQTNNLASSWENLQASLKSVEGMAGLMTTGPLKDLTDWGAHLAGDILNQDGAALREDLLAPLKALPGLIGKIPEAAGKLKTVSVDVIRSLFGDDAANRAQAILDDIGAKIGAFAPHLGDAASTFWNKMLGPALFGTDAERSAALANLGTWIKTDFAKFIGEALDDVGKSDDWFGKLLGHTSQDMAYRVRNWLGLDSDVLKDADGVPIRDKNGNIQHIGQPNGPWLPSQDPGLGATPGKNLAQGVANLAQGVATGNGALAVRGLNGTMAGVGGVQVPTGPGWAPPGSGPLLRNSDGSLPPGAGLRPSPLGPSGAPPPFIVPGAAPVYHVTNHFHGAADPDDVRQGVYAGIRDAHARAQADAQYGALRGVNR